MTTVSCSRATHAPAPAAERAAPVSPPPVTRVGEPVASTPKSGDPYELEDIVTPVEKMIAPQVGRGKNVGAVVGIRLRGETRFLSFGEIRSPREVSPRAA